MKMIAKHTVNLGTHVAAPGVEFEVKDEAEANYLIKIGAADQKTRVVADEEPLQPKK